MTRRTTEPSHPSRSGKGHTHPSRRAFFGAAAAGIVLAPSVARAQTRRWRMVTSWPKRLPGPGMSAERIAERVAALSGSRLQIVVHAAWVEAGGGQALWDELYAPFGVKPFMGGNTGVCMGGWFRRELRSADDLKGLKIR